MTFPSTAYKELCIENADRLERFYNPAFGDLVLCWDADKAEWAMDLWLVIGQYSEDAIDVFRKTDGAIGPVLIVDVAPLFQPRQLIEMLEERGYQWAVGGGPHEEPVAKKDYYFADCALPGECLDNPIQRFGPDPATALLRCLLEVAKEA